MDKSAPLALAVHPRPSPGASLPTFCAHRKWAAALASLRQLHVLIAVL